MLQDILNRLTGVLDTFRKRKPLSHSDTGDATVFALLNPGVPFKLLEIRFQTAALAAGETLSVTRVRTGKLGDLSTHLDYTILSEDLGTLGITDLVRTFDSDEGLFNGNDSIVPALSANTGSDRWGLEIKYELI